MFDENVGVYQIQAPYEDVEFLVFGVPKSVRELAAKLHGVYAGGVRINRLDAPNETPDAEDAGPAPACFTKGDPVTWHVPYTVGGEFITVDEEDPRFAYVRETVSGMEFRRRVRVRDLEHV